LQQSAIDRIESVAARLNDIPGVNSKKTRHLASFLESAPRSRNTRRAMLRLFEGSLVGSDGHTTGIVLELESREDTPVPRAETFARIRRTAREFDADAAVAGEPVQVFDMFQMVEQDAQRLFLVSLVILSAVLWIMFRGLRWVLAPVGLVLGSVVATRAILVLAEFELSMVGSMLNSLVTVIGIATAMHIIVHYRELRAECQESDRASIIRTATQTLQDLFRPVFWTCATTAVGFGSLFVSEITPVRSFALMMCLATGVVLVSCLFILPAALGSGSQLKSPARAPLEGRLERILAGTCHGLERFPLATGILCLVIVAAAVPGVFMLKTETDFSRNFKESSSIVQSLRFVESRLGSAGTWEVAFDTPEKMNDAFLENIAILSDRLRAIGETSEGFRVLSVTDVANLPPRLLGPARTLSRLHRQYPELISSLYNKERQRMRIMLRSREQQPAEVKEQLIREVRSTVTEFFSEMDSEIDQEARPATASGMFVLLTEVIQSLLKDQRNSFICATLGIFFCMTVAFRSPRIGLIALVPNIFPVAILLGALGWMQIPVNIGTAMIASVSMGLTVDSAIHYITAFEHERRRTTVSQALLAAHAGAGRAVVFAHLALVAGFLVLTASRFIPLVYFGGLMSLSMVTAVFGDLVLLPLLLRWTTPVSSAASGDSATPETPAESDQSLQNGQSDSKSE
jgi:predicted RND superfamily exporter protein